MNDMIKKIIEIVIRNIGSEQISTLDPNYELSQYGMNSIIFIHIVVDLEETFDIEIPDEYLLITEMNTLNKIINVVKNSLKSKG